MILASILEAFSFCKKIGRDWNTRFLLLQQAIRRGLAVRNRAWYARIVAEQTAKIFNLNLPNPVQLQLRTQDMPMLFEIFKREDYRLPIQKSLSDAAVVVDLGANIGLASVFFQQNYFPNARFILVEPSPKNLLVLGKNAATALKKAEIAPVAISDKQGWVEIDDHEVGFNVHILPKKAENTEGSPDVGFGMSDVGKTSSESQNPTSDIENTEGSSKINFDKKSTSVIALPMSKLMEDLHIKRIDLLKMDIEGAEKAVLKDAAAWLPKVQILIVELHGDYSETDLRNDVEPFGFQVTKTKAKHLYFAKQGDKKRT